MSVGCKTEYYYVNSFWLDPYIQQNLNYSPHNLFCRHWQADSKSDVEKHTTWKSQHGTGEEQRKDLHYPFQDFLPSYSNDGSMISEKKSRCN